MASYIFAFPTDLYCLDCVVSSHDISDASVVSASRDAEYLTKSRGDNPAQEDSSCLYSKGKTFGPKLKSQIQSTKSLKPSLTFATQDQCALSQTIFSLSTSAHSHSCVLDKHYSNITMTYVYNNIEL